MSFAATNLTPRTGVEIKSDPATLVSGEYAKTIRELLDARGAIVFPQINLTDEQQLAFSRALGGVVELGGSEIFKVSLDTKESFVAAYLRGTISWHFDGFNDQIPSLASILTCRVKSQIGGQTSFANTYAAWDDLTAARKQQIKDLRIVHSFESAQKDAYPNPTLEMKAAFDAFPKTVHPLVWTHRSGRKSLLMGSSADYVEGMDVGEGRKLIAELMAWATQPAFVYRHEWTVGDTVIWDNTGVLHKVDEYPADSGRMMHRTTLLGEEPIAA